MKQSLVYILTNIFLLIIFTSFPSYAELVCYTSQTECSPDIDRYRCYESRISNETKYLKKVFGSKTYKKLIKWKELNFFSKNDTFGGDKFCILDNKTLLIDINAARIASGFHAIDLQSLPKSEVVRLAGGGCSIKETLKDKNDNHYLSLYCVGLYRGVMSEDYKLVNVKNLKTNKSTELLYSGVQDGESGGCERYELLGIKTALINSEIEFKDTNNDYYPDILINITEQECATKKITKYTKIYLASDKGFKLTPP